MIKIPYIEQIKWVVCISAFGLWTFGAYTTGERLERAKWEREESKEKDSIIEHKGESEKDSQDAGQKYEKEKTVIQKKLFTPAKELNDELQGPAGDVELPGSLGVRLNELSGARKAQPSASKPN